MGFIDIRTLLGVLTLLSAVCTLVLALLWRRHRDRHAGVGAWVASFTLQTASLALFALRGAIPDWASVVVGNVFGVCGLLLLLVGLERYYRRPGPQAHNHALLIAFAAVHAFFTFVHPALNARFVSVSVATLLLCGQGVWLLTRRIAPEQRPAARPAALVLAGICALSAIRIAAVAWGPHPGSDYLRSGAFQASFLLGYLLLLALLTFSLVLLINDRLLAEVRAGEEKFAKAFQLSPNAILLVSLPEGRIAEVNDTFLRLWGHARADVLGKTTRELRLWARDEDREGVLATLVAQGSVREAEHTFLTRDGAPLTGLISVEIVTVEGAPWLLASISDITERKRMEERLREKSAEVERFAYAISHDLKSPLITVRAFLGYLEQDLARQDAEAVRSDLGYVRTAAEKMARMLGELLELSRLGRLVNAPVRASFRELAGEALAMVAGHVAQRGVAVQVGDREVALFGDRARLVEVWQNLLENAVKFLGDQPAPRVEIGVEQRGAETVFFVRDNGVGVAPESAGRIFEPFGKLDPGSAGTGLGLTVVRKIVELYGGRVWVEPSPGGAGATFLFTLPAALAAPAEAAG